MSTKGTIRRDRADTWSTIAFFFGGIAAIIGCFVAIMAGLQQLGDVITWGLAIASVGVALVVFADAIEIRATRVRRSASADVRQSGRSNDHLAGR